MNKINDLQGFWQAVKNEIAKEYNTENSDGILGFILSCRILDIKTNRIKEEDYIAKWQ